MERRDFLKITAGATVGMSGLFLNSGKAINRSDNDITYNTLPQWRGFNLLEKFTHKPDEWLSVAPEWGYRNDPFKESDFALISEMGFSYVRLPMSYKCWCEENEWYKLKEKHLKEIDQAVEWGKQYGLHTCINFHRSPGFTINDSVMQPQHREKTSIWDDDEALKACIFHWKHFAERYKGIPNKNISFNLFNEPVGTTEEKHDRVIRILVDEIMKVDPNRLIAIDGFNFAPSTNLLDLKIAQCARGYGPNVLTHYHATWGQVNNTLPTWPMKDKQDILWDKKKLQDHYKKWEDIERRGIGVYVGEFGCYNQTPHEVALAWMKDMLEIWQNNKWGWAMWCFRGSFGVANSGRKDVKYENFKGVQLDRKMLELIKAH